MHHENEFKETLHSSGNIYRIELTRKEILDENAKTNTIYLFFLLTSLFNCTESTRFFTNINRICKKTTHIMPILLTNNIKINELGLYQNYIMTGAYICKLFDYFSRKYIETKQNPSYNSLYDQCTDDEITNGSCTQDYSYIGDRYDTLFPYKQLKHDSIFVQANNDYEEKIRSIEKEKLYKKQAEILKELAKQQERRAKLIALEEAQLAKEMAEDKAEEEIRRTKRNADLPKIEQWMKPRSQSKTIKQKILNIFGWNGGNGQPSKAKKRLRGTKYKKRLRGTRKGKK